MSCTIDATYFKDLFDRGQFTYGTTLPDVRDKDINEAIAEAGATFNCALYPDEASCQRALAYLTAHYLTLDIEAANSGGQSVYTQTSRSADGISESLAVPDWVQNSPYAMFLTTFYGQKWLMLTIPYLGGAMGIATGATLP